MFCGIKDFRRREKGRKRYHNRRNDEEEEAVEEEEDGCGASSEFESRADAKVRITNFNAILIHHTSLLKRKMKKGG